MQAGPELRRPGEHDERPESEPEPAVGRERGCPEDVPVSELPHTREQLGQAAVEERGSEPDDVGDERRVVPTQQKRRQRERGEPQGRRIGHGRCIESGCDRPFSNYSHDPSLIARPSNLGGAEQAGR